MSISTEEKCNSDHINLRFLQSPLRYPGGKAALSDFLSDTLLLNNLDHPIYCEPFAGGAGAALKLLAENKVSSLILNDADYRIYAFWQSILKESERFIERIQNAKLTLEEWREQQAICRSPSSHKIFDIGFASFYLNRCNRSGILLGAGPIGGYEQKGKWKIDVRFNKDNLITRVQSIAACKDVITVKNKDAIDFLKEIVESKAKSEDTFVYLDPPYYSAGKRLYMNSYKDENHAELAAYLLKEKKYKWVMSYDNEGFIKKLYQNYDLYNFSLRYSLQVKQEASELLIVPENVDIPAHIRLGSKELAVQNVRRRG